MSRRGSLALKKRRDSGSIPSVVPISESEYINIIIINNIDEVCYFPNFSIESILTTLKEEQLQNLLTSFHYICNSNLLFDQLNNKHYEGIILHMLLYFLETEEIGLKNLKQTFIQNIFLLIEKLYLSKKYTEKELLSTIKFLICSSIYDRKEISSQNVTPLTELKNKKIKYYKQRFCLAIELVKLISEKKT